LNAWFIVSTSKPRAPVGHFHVPRRGGNGTGLVDCAQQVALPGPIAIALRNMMRICGLGSCFGGLREEEDFGMRIGGSGPAVGGDIVGGAGIDPTPAVRRLLFLPERRARL
jgi:hypothetical protein